MTAIILVGGKGTRISQLVPDLPKPLVPAAGQPFLHWVLRWVWLQGESAVVLAAQHLAEQIEAFAASENTAEHSVQICVEPSPLGTGGAVIHSAATHPDRLYLIANGDSLALLSLAAAYRWLSRDPSLDGVIAAVMVPDAARFGSLTIDEESLLSGFHEKRPGAGLINAGLYLLRGSLLQGFKGGALSMENDCFPSWLSAGRRIGVVAAEVPFIDIGTPQSLAEASAFIDRWGAMLDDPSQLKLAQPLAQVER